ncbi:MAG TPA: hypothetical protein H9962_09035 [Candidatus Mailhella merdigallinarum]|uniref:Uncharacterized protein n=1 Tax=Candidatus Mailhella merdigallinarum TaxID=2838658 RepID=A0A9D2KM18_9BACT|nr:hypothetical protein [Candidatus Mailhella merdigallinarum]
MKRSSNKNHFSGPDGHVFTQKRVYAVWFSNSANKGLRQHGRTFLGQNPVVLIFLNCPAAVPLKKKRLAVENGNRSGGGSGRPRRMSLKNTLFRRNDGSAAFEIRKFQRQNIPDAASSFECGIRPDPAGR